MARWEMPLSVTEASASILFNECLTSDDWEELAEFVLPRGTVANAIEDALDDTYYDDIDRYHLGEGEYVIVPDPLHQTEEYQ